MTTSSIKTVNFTATIRLPDDSMSNKAEAPRWEINLHEYGVLVAEGHKSRLIPWHAVESVTLEVARPLEVVEIVDAPGSLVEGSTLHEEEYLDADPATPTENAPDASPAPHSDAEESAPGRAAQSPKKARGKKG